MALLNPPCPAPCGVNLRKQYCDTKLKGGKTRYDCPKCGTISAWKGEQLLEYQHA